MLNTTNAYVQSCVATEKAVTAAFMAHVAPALEREGIILQLEPNKRLDRQGIDAVMLYENSFEYVDFKNHLIPPERKGNCNYAFELESAHLDQPGARFPGWLVDEKKVSTVYAHLFWRGTPQRIESIHVRMFRKQDLLDRLTQFGVDVQNWQRYCMESPGSEYDGKRCWWTAGPGYRVGPRIVHSMNLPEQPINLVVPERLLSGIYICDRYFELTKTKTA